MSTSASTPDTGTVLQVVAKAIIGRARAASNCNCPFLVLRRIARVGDSVEVLRGLMMGCRFGGRCWALLGRCACQICWPHFKGLRNKTQITANYSK